MSAFENERTAGSGDVALGFLAELERFLAVDRSTSGPGLAAGLLAWLRHAQAAQPTMALVHQLATRALEVLNAGLAREDSVAALREHLARSCAAEREDLDAARRAVSRTAVELLTANGAWIATLSHSGVVREALLAAARAGREPRVLVAESRPRLEGRALAALLAPAGVPVWLLADAALPLLVSQAAAVWIGADAVTDRGVLNKVGSYALALAAREHSVPVYALAERRKFVPAATPALRIAEMPPEEIWDAAPPGVRPRNVYFELVPLELLRGVVVEDAVIGTGEAGQLALERALPEELRGA
jgi:translation initiation factor 2B subunit (eIF-2B alpha/beta/delta family)